MTASPGEERASAQAAQRKIIGRAGIVASGTLVSRLLGLGREQVLAGMFSVRETDAFNIAFQIPNLLRQLVAEGAVQNGVLPVLSATRETEGDARTRDLFRKLRGLSLCSLIVCCTLGWLFAEPLVSIAAGGFDSDKRELTIELTRWLFPYLLFIGSAALGLAALNTYQRFVVTSFAPALLNVAFIASGLCLPAVLVASGYQRIYALAVGVWLGGAAQVLAQVPSLRAIGMARSPRLDFRDPGVRTVLRRLAPTLVGIGVYYVDVFVARRLLSELQSGSVSYFNYALRLCDFPQGIFIMALQAATLPNLSRLAAKGELRQLSETLSFGLRLSLLVAIPASFAFVTLAPAVVSLVLQRGHFVEAHVEQTASALMAQGLGIWMVAGVRQLVAAFYATGDTRTPVVVAAVDFCVFFGLAVTLMRPFGHVGVGLAVSGSSLVQFLLLALAFSRKYPSFEIASVARSGLLIALPCIPASFAAYHAAAFAEAVPTATWLNWAPAVAGCVVFAAVFLAGAALLRNQELSFLLATVKARKTR